ncbi:MAG: outer membrane beta-barrel protein [Chitinophagaceae bacterium]|nr:outer membrane beta-barrel protein [Chitinophagaceae bacterium]
MKKTFLLIGISLLSFAGFAQKGNNQINVGVELGLPTGDNGDVSKAGFGGTVKGLYGIGTAGQLSLTTGFISFSAKSEFAELLGADKITSTVVPILAGYRHHFSGFFVEPQVGYGIYGGKIKGGDFATSDSQGAFTWAAGVGYIYKNAEIGARYQSMSKDGESSGFVGIRLAYNFSLGGNK